MSASYHQIVCSIGGSDPTGGAGIQRDLKTVTAVGVGGTAILTALTVQGEGGVDGVWPVPVDVVRDQLVKVRDEVRPAVWKTGMLWSAEIVGALDLLQQVEGDPAPIVVDPVLSASAGGALATTSLVEALVRHLLPVTAVLTPNLPEAARLLDVPTIDPEGAEAAALALRELGPDAVVLKGGHGAGSGPVVDLVATADGVVRLEAPRVEGASLHGTGCRHASALAAHLTRGADVVSAARAAQAFVAAALSRERGEG